jgi:hypothetical protein
MDPGRNTDDCSGNLAQQAGLRRVGMHQIRFQPAQEPDKPPQRRQIGAGRDFALNSKPLYVEALRFEGVEIWPRGTDNHVFIHAPAAP